MAPSVEFQIISWHSCDENLDPKAEEEDNSYKSYNKPSDEKFVITIFGKDLDNKTYTLKIENFTPYFYIKVHDDFTKNDKFLLENWVRGEMQFKYRECLDRTSIVKKHSFRNFDNKREYKFVRFVFNNKGAMRNAVSKFQKRTKIVWNDTNILEPAKIKIPGLNFKPKIYELYENMIDPLLKFIHHRKIDTVSWVNVKKYKVIDISTTCDYSYRCDWRSIKKITDRGNTKINIMAFDIEADSAHGDFPLPIKDYTKLAREIYNKFVKLNKDDPNSLLDNKLGFVKKCLIAAFKNGDEELEISKIYNKPFGKIERSSLNIISSKIAEYLFVPSSKNSIEIKNHNIKCINEINKILSNKTTYGQLLGYLVDNEIIDDSKSDKFKWQFKKITDNYPPREPNKFLDVQDISKIVKHFEEHEHGYELEECLRNRLPQIKGDKTIQIGLSFVYYGSRRPHKNYMLTLKGCDKLSDAITECYDKESELLLRFREIIQYENPDIITGWNTDGFDIPWLFKRAFETNVLEVFSKMSKLSDFSSQLKKKQKKSYTGEMVMVDYVDMVGRIQMDLLPLVRKAYNLGSYKLDRVAAHFINGIIDKLEYDPETNTTLVFTSGITGLNDENFIIFNILDGYLDNEYMGGKKFEISELDKVAKTFKVNGEIKLDLTKKCKWCLGKDDVTPKDIFRLQKGTDSDRFIIAKYCMMDVILCIELLNKLELLTNNMGMANVCKSPLSWIIHRGQGVKILSLVSYFLRSKDYLLPFLYKDSFDKEGYEGAVVLDPNPGIYIDRPIAVLDYSSLYPSSMIEVNLSHETIVTDKNYLGEEGVSKLDKMGYDYEDITYDRYKTHYTPAGAVKSKEKVGEKTVRYVQYRDGTKGLIPQILDYLLSARKNTRKKIKYKTVTTSSGEFSGIYDKNTGEIKIDDNTITLDKEDISEIVDTYNEFEKKVLDGLQAAFKVTANSLYGQLGAKTSDIYYKELAASTTAVGRDRLLIAKDFAIDTSNYPQTLDNGQTIYLKNKITYGDTDSIFVEFQCLDSKGGQMIGRDARKRSIELAIYTEKEIQRTQLRPPQNLEYEKTFDPFILLSKKRYVGNLYEMDPDKYKRKSMGIVLKRRDNAPIVKVIYGGIIDIIMKQKDIHPAIVYLKKSLRKLVKNTYPIQTLIITKTLSSYYKDPDRIAHKVLADRIGERDPGKKPQINDRIPYIYIEVAKKVKLQGDRIEHPEFIKEHNLKPDYEFYITNQIMKPVSQIFALCLDELPGFTKNIQEFNNKYTVYLNKGKSKNDSIKYMLECKRKEAAKILFRDILRILENKRENNTIITDYFRKK